MFGFLALLNIRVYIITAVCVTFTLMLFVLFDTSHQMVGLVNMSGSGTYRVLGPFIVGFVTTPINWALTDIVGAIAAGLLWPLAALWLFFLVFLFIFSFIAPLFGWTLDWGRIFSL